jgi:hypothetical protein
MKSANYTIYLIFLAGILSLTGCTKEENTGTDPTDARSAFLGRWSVNETWTKLTYEVNISADPGSSNGVFIFNFANTGSSSIPAAATVSGTSILLDPDQVIGEDWIINGSGTLKDPKINWNYTINNGADLIVVTAIYTRL